jgi:4-aminobutyrate aminotransferase-like enzyme
MAGFKFSSKPVEVPRVETKYRRIVTQIPPPESAETLEALEKYESRAMHGQLPVVWEYAKGFQVGDPWGNLWIDFTSTIFVTNAGHGNPRIVDGLTEMLRRPLLHSYTFPTRIRAEYLRRLIEVAPPQFEKAFLLSAGTEATECGLKLMRMYGRDRGKRRGGVLAFEGNWHGRTLGAQMLSSNPAQKDWIGYLDPNIHHLPFPYPWRPDAMGDPRSYFRRGLNELIGATGIDPKYDLCGIMVETFQGWGAVFYPPEFVQEVAAFAKENDLVLAFDEMQAGFGRTGKLFGYMHYGVEPDLLCCGKGASSGFPLAVVLGSTKIMDLPEIGSMSSTHSANPLACAAGLANLQALFEDGLIENARRLGEIFQSRLNELQTQYPALIRCVPGKGLVAAVHFVAPDGTLLVEICNRICEESMRRGLLVVHTGRESIKLAPPLCISEEALLEGLQVFGEAVAATAPKELTYASGDRC